MQTKAFKQLMLGTASAAVLAFGTTQVSALPQSHQAAKPTANPQTPGIVLAQASSDASADAAIQAARHASAEAQAAARVAGTTRPTGDDGRVVSAVSAHSGAAAEACVE